MPEEIRFDGADRIFNVACGVAGKPHVPDSRFCENCEGISPRNRSRISKPRSYERLHNSKLGSSAIRRRLRRELEISRALRGRFGVTSWQEPFHFPLRLFACPLARRAAFAAGYLYSRLLGWVAHCMVSDRPLVPCRPRPLIRTNRIDCGPGLPARRKVPASQDPAAASATGNGTGAAETPAPVPPLMRPPQRKSKSRPEHISLSCCITRFPREARVPAIRFIWRRFYP